VIDATNPFGNGHLIPRGILREPIEALGRATSIILTRCDQVQDINPIIDRLKTISPQMPIRTTTHAPKHLTRVDDGEIIALEFLRDRWVKAACAVANPEAFFKTLEQLGARIADRFALPDHSNLPTEALESEDITVITEKDAVRLRPIAANLLSLHVEIEDYP
jgi:tetraacyldisaccharide 4'-kinase